MEPAATKLRSLGIPTKVRRITPGRYAESLAVSDHPTRGRPQTRVSHPDKLQSIPQALVHNADSQVVLRAPHRIRRRPRLPLSDRRYKGIATLPDSLAPAPPRNRVRGTFPTASLQIPRALHRPAPLPSQASGRHYGFPLLRWAWPVRISVSRTDQPARFRRKPGSPGLRSGLGANLGRSGC